MNEETILEIAEILSKWGFWQLLAIILIILLTAVLKIPIKKAAVKYEEKTGVDKSVITWVISLIPFILGFVAALVLELWARDWDVNVIDWATVVKQTSVLGAASMGFFEAVKKYAKAATAKSTAKQVEEAKKAPEERKQEVVPVHRGTKELWAGRAPLRDGDSERPDDPVLASKPQDTKTKKKKGGASKNVVKL